jgi:inner membrane protein
VLVVAAAGLVLGLWLAGGGGAVQKVSQQLGLKDGILAVYNQNAATHHVYADIQGVKASDRRDASGRYFILGTAGSEFVVTDGKGIYKTNEQIITSKLTTEVGEAATTQVRTLTFNDESAIAFGGASPIAILREQYVVGTVTAKIIMPTEAGAMTPSLSNQLFNGSGGLKKRDIFLSPPQRNSG